MQQVRKLAYASVRSFAHRSGLFWPSDSPPVGLARMEQFFHRAGSSPLGAASGTCRANHAGVVGHRLYLFGNWRSIFSMARPWVFYDRIGFDGAAMVGCLIWIGIVLAYRRPLP